MGSAPVQRSWQSRVSSSARRGAYVGNVPGVRRVTPPSGGSGGASAPAGTGGGGGGGTGTWLPSLDVGGGWVWDAGLYQETTFEAMSGFPASLPAEAQEFWYFVVEPGSDLDDDPGGIGSTGPRGRYGWDAGGYNEIIEFGSEPSAGAHLWVVWYGPDFDPYGTDPIPPYDPATLVSASLAEFGTG